MSQSIELSIWVTMTFQSGVTLLQRFFQSSDELFSDKLIVHNTKTVWVLYGQASRIISTS